MNKKKMAAIALIPTLGVAALAGSVFAASESTATPSTHSVSRPFKDGHGMMNNTIFTQDLATALGLTVADVQAKIDTGQTPDQIITATGISKDTVMAAMKTARDTAMKAKLAEKVAAGTITQAQADEMLTRMTAAHGKEMREHKGGLGDTKHTEALATALGMTTTNLQAALTSGKTIDEITTSLGLTKEAVMAKMEASRPKDADGNPLHPTHGPRGANTKTSAQ